MSTLFTGLAEFYKKYAPTQDTSPQAIAKTLFLGQVLDVVDGEKLQDAITKGDVKVDSFRQAGAIRVKIQGPDDGKYEDDVIHVAFPANRNILRLPIPGELVLLVSAQSSAPNTSRAAFFYIGVLTGIEPTRNAAKPAALTTPIKTGIDFSRALMSRFDKKYEHNTFTINQQGKYIPTLREGDKILEGRFGGSIKFTSTVPNQWSDVSQIANARSVTEGIPSVVIKNTKYEEYKTDLPVLVDDDINVDMSSIYLNTGQVIPAILGSSAQMNTWDVDVIERISLRPQRDDQAGVLSSFFPETYDPNLQIEVQAEILISAGALDDNFDSTKGLGSAEAIPFTGQASTRQEQIVRDALNASFAKGETKGLCAKGTYNHAANYMKLFKGEQPNQGMSLSAGGNANQTGFFNAMVRLGYQQYTGGSGLTRQALDDKLRVGPWNVGDAVTYWASDGDPSKSYVRYGHAQMYVGNITGRGNWTTDNRFNYRGSYFVYKSQPSNSWNLVVFKAPLA